MPKLVDDQSAEVPVVTSTSNRIVPGGPVVVSDIEPECHNNIAPELQSSPLLNPPMLSPSPIHEQLVAAATSKLSSVCMDFETSISSASNSEAITQHEASQSAPQ
ncbi:hypothetical protein V6N13_042121 [Hibiscus sabdariffa]|uniref:Uncharacterized protein n=1 Tax=Hibiscus sabdariffa TaxID=183260 RepID=A0ABR2DE32_9ROSI